MLKLPVYLDYNATTPCDARVVESMLPYFTESFGNAASRTHYYGWQAEEAVELAREQVAALIGSEPKEIVFTSGATESDNLALKGVFEAYASKGNHIITCVTEHKAVLDTCKQLEKKGAKVTYLPVNRDGLIDTGELESAIDTHTVLIALMFANNELGVIQPVKEIGEIAKKHGVLFFTDAAQAVGKIPVSVNELGVDMLSISAHKMYGPKGVGAIYMRRKNPRVKLQAQIEGGGHERAVRSGTLNVPGIVGLGKACELARKEMEAEAARLSQLRNKLERILLEEGDVYINGNQFNRLPHVSNIGFRLASGEALMLACNKDIAVSSGSACSSASMEPSYVLKAIGLSDEEAYGSLRFSLGRFTTEEEIDHATRVLVTELRKIRELNRSILSE